MLGLGFYLFMTAVNSPWAWRAGWPVLWRARLGSLIAGIVFVLYLLYTELFTLDAICLWCTSIHIITFLLFALVVITATLPPAHSRAVAVSWRGPAALISGRGCCEPLEHRTAPWIRFRPNSPDTGRCRCTVHANGTRVGRCPIRVVFTCWVWFTPGVLAGMIG